MKTTSFTRAAVLFCLVAIITLTGYVPTAKRALALVRLCTTFRGHYSALNSH